MNSQEGITKICLSEDGPQGLVDKILDSLKTLDTEYKPALLHEIVKFYDNVYEEEKHRLRELYISIFLTEHYEESLCIQ
jgi:hypothetical protein